MKRNFILAVICMFVSIPYSVAVSTTYPSIGTTDLISPCKRSNKPNWVKFYCNFMTKEIWERSGGFAYAGSKDIGAWIPFYYVDTNGKHPRNNGLLEGFKKRGAGIEDIRYTPWSVFLKKQMGCEGKVNNPFYLLSENVLRSKILSLGWKAVKTDEKDPTQGLEQGSFFTLFSLANLQKWVSVNWRNESHIDLAYGGYLRPDYHYDGGVWLVKSNGDRERFDNLDKASKVLDETGMLFINDSFKSWRDGLIDAIALAKSKNRNIVYMYLAQDIFYDWSNNSTFRKRLKYLINKTMGLCKQDKEHCLKIVSHGWSSHIVASTTMKYPKIKHFLLNPAPGFWGYKEYVNALEHTVATSKILYGGKDFISPLGRGVYFNEKEVQSVCY